MEEGGGWQLKLVTIFVVTGLGSASLAAAAAVYGFTFGKTFLFVVLCPVLQKLNRFDPKLNLLNFEGRRQKINQQFWPLDFTGV